ncbi:MAG: aldehyde dehydrogenase, partial [Nocardioides sp.]|nr:aldehyde dehydrogenase [Nocardioides sp.]
MTTQTWSESKAGGRLYVAGEWSEGDGSRREVLDPSTGAAFGTVVDASPEDVAQAVSAARATADAGEWAQLPPRERGRVLFRVAELVRTHAEELAHLESHDTGKPLLFSRSIDVPTVADTYEYYGALTASIEGATRATAFPSHAYTRREPVGVVAAITPFNFPLILSTSKLAPALAAGNTVVHKPAEETPVTALRMAELLAEAGVPAGVLSVLPGGAETGRALVGDERVDKVAFTGSTAVGRSIAETAGRNLQHVTLELGGKAADIVFADADIEKAVGTAISAFVFNTGQFCMAGSRLLVERPVYDDVLAAVAEGSAHVPVGDPFAEGTVIGPMAGERHLDKVRSYVARAREAGVRVLGAGAASDGVG